MTNILIVVDMQNDFITGPLGTPEACAIVPAVKDLVKKWDGPILATLDTHQPSTYLVSHEGRNLPVPHCYEYTEGWLAPRELNDLYSVKKDFKYVEKETFGCSDLIGKINAYAIGRCPTIYLCGVCTDICVVSNALILREYFHESEIYVIEDCCAGVTPEKHDAAIKVMESCQIKVIKSTDVKTDA